MERALPKSANLKKKAPPRKERAAAVSQNQQAYSRLKDALTTLAYRPGDYLNVVSLMDELALGRTPINHALHRLSNEGLVQIIPRKGVMVAPLSIDEALDLIDVRMANEILCARLTAVRITKAELQLLRSLAREIDAAAEGRNMAQVMNADRLFHEQIAQAAGNQILVEILNVLHARSQRFWAISLSAEGHLDEVKAEHRAIVDALAKADPDAAAAAVEAHVLSFRRSLLHTR